MDQSGNKKLLLEASQGPSCRDVFCEVESYSGMTLSPWRLVLWALQPLGLSRHPPQEHSEHRAVEPADVLAPFAPLGVLSGVWPPPGYPGSSSQRHRASLWSIRKRADGGLSAEQASSQSLPHHVGVG